MVADYFDLDVETLKSKSRKRHIVTARQLAMFFVKKYTEHSLKNIGDAFGGRDHSTVIYSCLTVNDLNRSPCCDPVHQRHPRYFSRNAPYISNSKNNIKRG